MHLRALIQMGAEVDGINHGLLRCRAQKLTGCEILLDSPVWVQLKISCWLHATPRERPS
jgi:UDP-N-acetylglucosamine enolpyruvyl transferase